LLLISGITASATVAVRLLPWITDLALLFAATLFAATGALMLVRSR
jgi:hypothetical protein